MKLNKEKQLFLISCLSFLFLIVSIASAQNLQAIKAQMQNRKPTVDAFKAQGIVGEGVDGYLHVRQNNANANIAVQAENADRRAVNETIARKEGTTVEQVSRKLAVKLIEVASPGQWIWKADGSWYQK